MALQMTRRNRYDELWRRRNSELLLTAAHLIRSAELDDHEVMEELSNMAQRIEQLGESLQSQPRSLNL